MDPPLDGLAGGLSLFYQRTMRKTMAICFDKGYDAKIWNEKGAVK